MRWQFCLAPARLRAEGVGYEDEIQNKRGQSKRLEGSVFFEICERRQQP
jgi:hypothetical protein